MEVGSICKELLSNCAICVFVNFKQDISFEMNCQLGNAKC